MCWNCNNGVIGVMVFKEYKKVEFKDTKYIFLFSLKVPSTECASYCGICLVCESQQRTSGVEPCLV